MEPRRNTKLDLHQNAKAEKFLVLCFLRMQYFWSVSLKSGTRHGAILRTCLEQTSGYALALNVFYLCATWVFDAEALWLYKRHAAVYLAIGSSLAAIWFWLQANLTILPLNTDHSTLRHKFKEFVAAGLKTDPQKGSHPFAALERTRFHEVMMSFVRRDLKRKPYVFDMCHADVREHQRGRLDGNRYHYVDKDLQMPIVKGTNVITKEHVAVFTDSDYLREDMPEIISSMPCVMYTFFPESTGGCLRDGVFNITADNVTHSFFSGGGTGDQVGGHPIWNWMQDVVSVQGLGGRTVVLIEARRVSPHRFLVFTVPIAWVPDGYVNMTDAGLVAPSAAVPFSRMRYAIPLPKPDYGLEAADKALPRAVIALQTLEDGEEWMYLSIPGESFSVRLRRCSYVSLFLAYHICRKPGINQSLCDSALSHYTKGKVEAARTLHSIMLASWGVRLNPQRICGPSNYFGMMADVFPALRVGLGDAPNKPDDLQAQARVVDERSTNDTEAPNPGRTICRPLVDRNVVYANNAAGERAIIETRVDPGKEQQKPQTRVFKRKIKKYLQDFMQMEFCEHKGLLSPLPMEEVNDAMTKASQKADYEQVIDFLHHRFDKINAFVKKESVPKPSKHPHLIQPVSKEHKVMYSSYTLAFASLMKRKDWYAFGKKPREIAERIHSLAANADTLLGTDYSQWDGTLDALIRDCELDALLYVFHPDHHDELKAMHASEINQQAKLPLGTSFEPGTMRLSGSPITAIGNSFLNAFVSYVVMREAKQEVKLGVYGGDDGLNVDIDPQIFKKVCEQLNLIVKVESEGDPERPITFLARTYINPARGPESVSDVRRLLGKLHIFVAGPDVTAETAMARKAVAITVSDSTTPLVGHLGRLLYRSNPDEADLLLGKFHAGELSVEEGGWNLSQLSKAWNEDPGAAYPAPSGEEAEVIQLVADALSIDSAQLVTLCDSIDETPVLDELDWPQICPPDWTAARRVFVAGEWFEPGEGERGGFRTFTEQSSGATSVTTTTASRTLALPFSGNVHGAAQRKANKNTHGGGRGERITPPSQNLPSSEVQPSRSANGYAQKQVRGRDSTISRNTPRPKTDKPFQRAFGNNGKRVEGPKPMTKQVYVKKQAEKSVARPDR